MSCIVCGRFHGIIDPHHRVPKCFAHNKRGKRSRSWDPDNPGNVVPVCRTCHDTYNSSIYVGQVPYEGPNSDRQRQLARRVSKLLAVNERFWEAMPWFVRRYYNRFRKEL